MSVLRNDSVFEQDPSDQSLLNWIDLDQMPSAFPAIGSKVPSALLEWEVADSNIPLAKVENSSWLQSDLELTASFDQPSLLDYSQDESSIGTAFVQPDTPFSLRSETDKLDLTLIDLTENSPLLTELPHSITQTGIRLWSETGIDQELLSTLQSLTFEVSNLPGRTLAKIEDSTISFDIDAAGQGWYIDPTPLHHEEFNQTSFSNRLKSRVDSLTFGKIDLLTVVAHEMGHALGLEHPDEHGHLLTLLAQNLAPGERRLPSMTDLHTLDKREGGTIAQLNSHEMNLAPTVTWVGGSGDWDDPNNWSTGVLPGVDDIVLIDVPDDVTIRFDQGDITVNSLFSEENFTIAGGSLRITTEGEFKNGLILSNGILTGEGTITTDSLIWQNGTQSGNGETIVTGNLLIEGGGSKFLVERNITTQNNAVWQDGTIILNEGAVWNNAGTLDIQTEGNEVLLWNTGAEARFNNAGTLIKRTGDSVEFRIDVNNAGTFDVQTGRVLFSQDSETSGDINVADGASLAVTRGTHDFLESSALAINGTGGIEFLGGTVNLNGLYSDAEDSTLLISGAAVNALNNLNLSNLTQTSGVLAGDSDITIGSFNWNGGTQRGNGETSITDSLRLESGGSKQLIERTLRNQGTAIWQDGVILLNEGAIWDNIGTFDIQTEGNEVFLWNTGVEPAFTNSGNIIKRAGGRVEFRIDVVHSGALEVLAGSVLFSQDSEISGDISVANGAGVAFSSGTHNLLQDSNISGNGAEFEFGGTVNIDGSYNIDNLSDTFIRTGIVNFNENIEVSDLAQLTVQGGTININVPNLSIASLTQTAGVISGSGSFEIDRYVWNGGTQSGSGETVITDTLTIGGPNSKILSERSLTTTGTSTWEDGVILLRNGAIWTIDSAGLLDIQGDDIILWNTGDRPQLINEGSVIKSAGDGTTEFRIDLINQGSIENQTGTIQFSQDSENRGNLNILDGTTLAYQAGTHNFQPRSRINASGASRVEFQAGSINQNGSFDVDNATITEIRIATVTIDNNIEIPNLVQSGGILGGTGLVSVENYLWSGGTQNGVGQTTVSDELRIESPSSKILTERTLNTLGDTIWENGTILLSNGAVWNNEASGLLDIQGDNVILWNTGDRPIFNNFGGIVKSAGDETSEFRSDVVNAGNIEGQDGTLRFSQIFTNNDGSTLENGGILEFTGTVIDGTDAIDLVVNDATVSSEVRPGETLALSWTVINQGTEATTAPFWVDSIYLSTDNIFDASDTFLVSATPEAGQLPLAPDASYTVSSSLTIPNSAALGDQFLLFVTDQQRRQLERNEDNNVFAQSIEILEPVREPPTDTQLNPNSIPENAGAGDVIGALTTDDLDLGDTHVYQLLEDAEGRFRLDGDRILVADNNLLNFESDIQHSILVQTTDSFGLSLVKAITIDVVDINEAPTELQLSNTSVDENSAAGTVIGTLNTTDQDVGETHAYTLNNDAGGRFAIANTNQLVVVDPSLLDAGVATSHTITIQTEDTGGLRFQQDFTLTIRDVAEADLEVESVTSANASATFGDPFEVSWVVRNTGTEAAIQNWRDRLYLSIDQTLSADDIELGDVEAPSSVLEPNQSYTQMATIEVPNTLNLLEGKYFLIVNTDINQVQAESNELNNIGISSNSLVLTLEPAPDLEVVEVLAPTLTVGDPAQVTIEWEVQNTGDVEANGPGWVDRIIARPLNGGGDRVIAEFTRNQPLQVGASYRRQESILLPPRFQGNFELLVSTDADQTVFENQREDNNILAAANNFDVVRIPYADLIVMTVDSDLTGQSGQPFTVSWTVQNDPNQGIGITNSSSWSDRLRLSTDPQGNDIVADLGVFDRSGRLALGDSYTRTVQANLPDGLVGTFYLVVETGGPFEFIYTDNNRLVSAQPIEISLSPTPDLVVTDIVAPPAIQSGSQIDVTWQVDNTGLGAANDSWRDRIFLQDVNDPNAPRIQLGSFNYVNSLGAGNFYRRSELFTLPDNLEGVFQVVVETNSTGSQFELIQDNNSATDDQTMVVSLTPRPDLQVSEIIAPDTVDAGGTIALEFEVINQGIAATSTPNWEDRAYLSLDDELSGDDILIGTFTNQTALGPDGDSYRTITDSLIVPKRFRDEVFLIVQTDARDQVNEFPQDNNNTLVKALQVQGIPPADLVTSDVTLIPPTEVIAGSEVEVRYTVTNRGAQAGETDRNAWTDTIWLTRDRDRPSTLARGNQPNDILLRTLSHTGSLKFGESYEEIVTVSIPTNIEAGQWYITPWTDTYDVVFEETFAGNQNPDVPTDIDGNNFKAQPINVIVEPIALPDLVVASVTPTAMAEGGESFTVDWTVENQGTGETSGSWVDQVYLSDQPTFETLGANHWLLGTFERQDFLANGDSYSLSETFELSPAAAGEFVIVRTNRGLPSIQESDRDNNARAAVTDVTNSPADLVVTDIVTPQENFSGETITVQWTVENRGAPLWEGTRFWTDQIYLSPYPTLTQDNIDSATILGSETIARNQLVNGQYTQTSEVRLPAGIDGNFYLYILTDTSGSLPLQGNNEDSREEFESQVFEDPTNNLSQDLLPVVYREPDLVVTDLSVPQQIPQSGETIPISWTVTNQGTRDTRQSFWFDRVYLSSDQSLDDGDQLLGRYQRSGILPIGEFYQPTVNVDLPDGIEGEFYILVFTDSNIDGPLPPAGPLTFFEQLDRQLARVGEYQDEGNNITAVPLSITLADPPDLQVTRIEIPERVTVGQSIDLTYEVTNVGPGDTPEKQGRWDDLIYLSRDEFLDLNSDRYLGFERHQGGLAAGDSYEVSKVLNLPNNLTGPFFIFVVTDPRRNTSRGVVFEGANEANNATPSTQPLIIELPPPSDLQVEEILIPGAVVTGDPVDLEWTVINQGENSAEGQWTDAVYLSEDGIWDIGDRFIGRATFEGSLAPGETYTLTSADMDEFPLLPPATEGQYRLIVRPDIFNQVYEAENEANNRTASADALSVTVPELQLGVRLETTLSTGQDRLYRIEVGVNQTLQVSINSESESASNELFLRFNEAPTVSEFDAAYEGFLAADQTAVIPTTEPGVYYVLVRGLSQPQADTPVQILAEVLPFEITDVTTDRGGDSRYVTTTISGAQFHPDALVKFVRPGIAEFEPVRYEVIDSTRIVAIFDFTDAIHGLYDVKVINPDGQEAIVPYRYLVERAIEPDIDIGVGGPRVLAPGDTGTYSVSVKSLTNLDTPYVHFQFGIPELGENDFLYQLFEPEVRDEAGVDELPYTTFFSNLRGAPDVDLQEVPWSSLVSDVNTSGEILAPGYVLDLETGGFAGSTFNSLIYDGLPALLELQPDALDDLEEEDHAKIAFTFHLVAAATALTRDEFIAQQRTEALALRDAILADDQATETLRLLVLDEEAWIMGYLAALEETGLLRPEDEAPPIRDNALVISLLATLATGILAGPSGEEIQTDGNLLDFFMQIRQWYDHDPTIIGSAQPPAFEDFDLGLSQRTHFEAFDVFVPFETARVDLPPFTPIPPLNFGSALAGAGATNEQTLITGPLGFGDRGFVPVGTALPYTIEFANTSNTTERPGEIRIVSQLDADLDPRSFQLGNIQIGDIPISIPTNRANFQGRIDLTDSHGFILSVVAGIDPIENIATWVIQAIDPDTGEIIQNPALGLLAPNDTEGRGRGLVSYTIEPLEDVVSGADITAQARVIFNTTAPTDTTEITHVVDALAPSTELTVTQLSPDSPDYRVEWNATDDENGSGVKHVTVYVAENGGDFRIWKRQTQDTEDIYTGVAGNTYEFLALAIDNAGNQEQVNLGTQPPDDGSSVNLGGLPSFDSLPEPELLPPPEPTPNPTTNPLFQQAQAQLPNLFDTTRPSEFEQVLQPFVAESFAVGIGQSHGDIGPMAIAPLADDTVLISGGPARNQLFLLPRQGGEVSDPLVTLPYPIFDLEVDANGNLWATTGGGPLLQLDPTTGQILQEYADGLTQTLAADPSTGNLYVSSGNGIEIFNPDTQTFSHFSNLRVGNLAFDSDGNLWVTRWPERGEVIRFTPQGDPQLMFELNQKVDSIAFGKAGSPLENLLFISDNEGQLTMVDRVTLQQVAIATGGSRGDIVETTLDGRVLLSQSQQVDSLSPLLPPIVAFTNPAPDGTITLPQGVISVTFDRDMFLGNPDDERSVLNPANYELMGTNSGVIVPEDVQYDSATRTAFLSFPALIADEYQLLVDETVQSRFGLALGADHQSSFTAISDFLAFVDFRFSNARSDRANRTISYEVEITNTATTDIQLPFLLLLDPTAPSTGQPQGTIGRDNNGAYLLDLSDSLSDGVLKAGESVMSRTITIENPDQYRADFAPGIFTLPFPNQAAEITSVPNPQAAVEQPYEYQVIANDPDGTGLSYLLLDAPDGMELDPVTGLLTWTPPADSPADIDVTLQVYDNRGTPTTQRFAIAVAGGNIAPIILPLPDEIVGQEGEPLQVALQVNDPDDRDLRLWADNLPPGAIFNPETQTLTWTPGFNAAGTYEQVAFYASDGVNVVSQVTALTISPTNQSPELIVPSDRTIQEGETLRIQLRGTDPENDVLSYGSNMIPGGAFLNPNTGVFEWTPTFFQAGTYEIPFTVSDGTSDTTETTTVFVLNANGAPEFDTLTAFEVQEGQTLDFNAFAFDPDNPRYIPSFRLEDGTLVDAEETTEATVTYSVDFLPPGATFDDITTEFSWTPDFDAAGDYSITFTATDDGDDTGEPKTDTVTVPVKVRNSNRPPEITETGNQTLQRGEVQELLLEVIDPDGGAIFITAEGLPGFPIPDFATLTENGDGTALLRLEPGFNDRGDYTFTITATDDGDGGSRAEVLSDSYTFIVSVEAFNEPPVLSFVGDKVAVVGELFTLPLEATDLDQENLTFTVNGLPVLPQALTSRTALLEWTPTAVDVGIYAVEVSVTDGGNGDPSEILTDQESFTVIVRTSNQAPVLDPIPVATVDEGDALTFTLAATDPDGDTLTYTALNLPGQSSLDPVSGVFSWIPTLLDAGDYPNITFAVSDGHSTSLQTINITVTNTNQAPIFVPLPAQAGRENVALQFSLTAGDVDGDALSYSPLSVLPTGAVFDSETATFSWTPGYEQAGDYLLEFVVQDASGARDTLDVSLRIANVNRPPTLEISDRQVPLGETLNFQVLGEDPDQNTTLTYEASNLPEGALFDPVTGVFSWMPGPGQVGDYVLNFTASDGEASTQEAVLIRATLNPTPPDLTLEITPSFPGVPNQAVVINVLEDSLSEITSLVFMVDGEEIEVDERGRGRFVPDQPGHYLLEATVTDEDNLTSQVSKLLKVRDPDDVVAPIVNFIAGLDGSQLNDVTEIFGSVTDTNLDEWELGIRKSEFGGQQYAFETLASGRVSINDALTEIDPRTLMNGFYELQLTAIDIGGRRSQAQALIEINTREKIQQYRRSETDLTLEIGNASLELVRSYNSQNTVPGSFGKGWRLANTDTQLQTNLPSADQENLGLFNPFREGTRLFLTLPNGERVGFTFQPVLMADTGLATPVYRPEWIADEGIDYALRSTDSLLTKAGNRYYILETALPYNPSAFIQNAQFNRQPSYTLSAPDGILYHLDPTGQVTEQITPDGISVIFSDSGISTSTGKSVTFQTNEAGYLSRDGLHRMVERLPMLMMTRGI